MISSVAPPIPFLPSIVSGVLALLVTAWGMAALWSLALRHEDVSLRRIHLVWLIGLIAGTSTAVYYLVQVVRSPGPDDSVFILPIGSLLFLEATLLLHIWVAERVRRRVES
jgi:predicted membrane-bound spermidine synthase